MQVREEYPSIDKLLEQPALTGSQLPTRLYCCYTAHERKYGGGEVVSGSGTRDAHTSALRALAYIRPFAMLSYTAASREALAPALADQGYTLLAASYSSILEEGCPAYYLCHSGEREVMLVLRGTYSAEDVISDLLGVGEDLQVAGAFGHSGMSRAARFLYRKFGGLLALLARQGLTVTLVGHSLGAGVAALLALLLKAEGGLGAEQLQCWAFCTPACMDLDSARACSGGRTAVCTPPCWVGESSCPLSSDLSTTTSELTTLCLAPLCLRPAQMWW